MRAEVPAADHRTLAPLLVSDLDAFVPASPSGGDGPLFPSPATSVVTLWNYQGTRMRRGSADRLWGAMAAGGDLLLPRFAARAALRAILPPAGGGPRPPPPGGAPAGRGAPPRAPGARGAAPAPRAPPPPPPA